MSLVEEDGKARYSIEGVKRWATAVFEAVGVTHTQASQTAEVLVRTDLRGVHTHGVVRIPDYVSKIRSGEINAKAEFSHTYDAGVLRFDGNGGLGQAVMSEVIALAVQYAQQTSVVSCFVRNSGHLAALGQFTLAAAELGMVAFLCQETPPLMALPGAKAPAIGNNPLSFATPIKGQSPLVFDMATSVVARGNVLGAMREGRQHIPSEWAIGPDGLPTTDPKLAMAGAMQAMAGHKGIGLAMMVQVLAGSLNLSTAADSAARHGSTSSAGNVSAFFLLMNLATLVGADAFDTNTKAWVNTYLSASGEQARYPGQRAGALEQESMKHGLAISLGVRRGLQELGVTVGVPFIDAIT